MPRVTRIRRAGFTVLVVLLVYGVIELSSWIALGILDGEAFSIERFSEERRRRQEIERVELGEVGAVYKERRKDRFLLHPFVGAITDPRYGGPHRWWIRGLGEDPLDDTETFNVVLAGGSMARQFGASGWPALRDRLSEAPPLRARSLRLIDLSDRGNKQPQQLMAVNYLLALGGRIDLLINLDGFNEVGDELHSTIEYGVFPAYPWTWVPLTKALPGQEDVEKLGEIYGLRLLRSRWARAFDFGGFSPTAALLWQLVDRSLERREFVAMKRYVARETLPRFSRGPEFEGGADERFYFSVDLWVRSSLALHALSKGFGFPYFHFLQPNQYVPDSKPLSDEERRKALSRPRLAQDIPRWYPVLSARGRDLRANGVRFHDLTRLYADTPDTVYVDRCCHVNRLGNALMAERIASVVIEYYSTPVKPVREPPRSSEQSSRWPTRLRYSSSGSGVANTRYMP